MSYVLRMQRRARIVRSLRAFFDEQGFVEVDTPVAQSTLAPEPQIEAPEVFITSDKTRRRFLQTSPELLMKRLLARGLDKIYQVCPAFRQTDHTALHRPEFRIVEWYRRNESFDTLMDDCEGLLRRIARELDMGDAVSYAGRVIPLGGPFRRVTVEDAFLEHAGFSILDALEPAALRERLRNANVHFSSEDSWDDLFHRIFLSRVEPALLQQPRPLFLTHYPKPLASLARTSVRDARTAERFELYVGGMELANAFGELTDVGEQRERFARDRTIRLAQGKHDYPHDERFFEALGQIGQASGIALGLERLIMLFCDARDIDEVAALPWDET